MENKSTRLSKAARLFNVGISTIVEFLAKKDIQIDSGPNTKISPEAYNLLAEEYSSDLSIKQKSEELSRKNLEESHEGLSIDDVPKQKDLSKEEVIVKDVSAPKVKKEVKSEVPVVEKKPELKEEKKEKEPKAPSAEKKKKSVDVKVVGKIDLDAVKKKPKPSKKTVPEKPDKQEEEKAVKAEPVEEKAIQKKPETIVPEEKKNEIIETKIEKLSGPTVVGKINLPKPKPKKKPVASSSDTESRKKKRKRIRTAVQADGKEKGGDTKTREAKKTSKKRRPFRPEVSEEDVQKKIKETLSQLSSKGKSKGARYRREKRDAVSQKEQEEIEKSEQEKSILKVTEFVSVNELSSMMDVPANDVISVCMSLGVMVSINQRLDAETMTIVADEFGFKIEFITVDLIEAIDSGPEDKEEDLKPRPPIVTVMGHVDHGKTKLLDYIRSANVVAGEAGGITQHIGAYSVELSDSKIITFLDTPGHEAFTAMRARGAQVTDIVIIVVAADDGVKPQTVEAINHAQAAGVPIVFAINKIDKPAANSEKVKEELSNMNILVEDWGGKYQSQEISAKNGINIDELLEKILLEAEMLELKANPDKKASGIVLESTLDKGKGFVTTLLISEGTLHVGDISLAGNFYGHAKAMFNERGGNITEAGPSSPVIMLGLDGAPQAGDTFNVMNSDREAKEVANRREQLQREQGLRTKKHITLDELGRRIAIGNFQELNVVIKGDVDGSVEALGDSLLKLSTEEIQLNVIHKAVGQISESDVMLAIASNAIVMGFQVRPSLSARKMAEKEQIDIRTYSIIYDAIEEIKSAMEGLLSPEVKEEIVATVEVLEIFKIEKAGTIAGCVVKDGKVKRDNKVRIIRDGIVVYSGELGSLKRFKDDAKEVVSGLECGLNIANYNDIKVGDVIEAYVETEFKRTL
ncbi:MAG: translation initiation factor IF-2 [Bacteroidota bacterium]|nr:translation initiation factor IF-2 [Bacteroidota bacterium]